MDLKTTAVVDMTTSPDTMLLILSVREKYRCKVSRFVFGDGVDVICYDEVS